MRGEKSTVSDDEAKGSHRIKRSGRMLRPAQRATIRKVRSCRSSRAGEAELDFQQKSASLRPRLRSPPQNYGACIWVVRFRSAEVLAQERADIQDPRSEPVSTEQLFYTGQTERVPMILLGWAHDVFGDFIQVEE